MIWLLVGLAIAFVVFCACLVSGQQDESAGELERAMRERRE
jgi:hypothetical protein